MLPSLRTRTVALVALFSFTTFFVSTVPEQVSPIERPAALTPAPVDAAYCANVASFEGRLTSSSSSTTMLSTDFCHSSGSGEARLIRYEACDSGWPIFSSRSVSRNWAASSSVIFLARHWLLFFVKSCTTSQPAARANWTAL